MVAVPLGSRAEEAGLMPGDRLEAGDAMEIMALFRPTTCDFPKKRTMAIEDVAFPYLRAW